MIVVKINESGQVFSAYETYPAYRQLVVGELFLIPEYQ